MKISKVRLRVGFEAIDRRPGSPLAGEIWVDADGVGFPEAKWRDLIVPLLLAWSRTALKVKRGAKSGRVLFMEGPFEVEVAPFPGELWRVRFLERGLKKRIVLRELLTRSESLLQSLLAASQEALAVARAAKSWSKDEEALATSLADLEALARTCTATRSEMRPSTNPRRTTKGRR